MTAIATSIQSAPTLADRQAAANFAANTAALCIAQPEMVESLPDLPRGLSFIFGRDGALTAMNRDGSWWQGCSLPRRAALAILKTLDSVGRVSCYLSPTHAAQVRVALDKLPAEHAVIALCPDDSLLKVMLHCEDFSADIAAHRLLFAGGTGWQEQLAGVFEQYPGLPVPEQFIRGAAADHDPTNALITPAQKIFAERTSLRSAKIAALRDDWSPGARPQPRICLIAPSHFQLWEDGGDVLHRSFANISREKCEIVRFDTDDPTSAAPMALAKLASECDAVISLNIARADLPDILSPKMPWITWLVREQVPAGGAAGPGDALVVADARARSEAIAKGWPADRIKTAFWPTTELPPAKEPSKLLSMIVDTRSIDPPPRIREMSSQRLLWEAIAEEMASDPFIVTPNPAKYLRRRQRELRIPEENFDTALFLNLLIAPAFAQSLARFMLKEHLPLCVMGAGWGSMAEFADVFAGPIASRAALAEAVASSLALVYAWPTPRAHPMDACCKPVLHPAAGCSQFIAAAKLALQGKLNPATPAQSVLHSEKFLSLVKSAHAAPLVTEAAG